MADRKISELTNITGANLADDDEFALVDTSADETKAITFGEFKTALDTATGFVRITGDTMTGNLSMGDNVKAIFGAGSDLQIYHDGAATYISDVGSGSLNITSDNTVYINKGQTEVMAKFNIDGAVELYHDNSRKLATTSTGVDITGTLTSDELTINNSGQSQTLLSVGGGSTNAALRLRGSTGSAYAWQISSNAYLASALEFTKSTAAGGTTFSTPSMILDNSGNLLLGKTDTSIATQGVFLGTNYSHITSTNDTPLALSRKSSDGIILDIRKDGTTVGVIGTHASNITIGTGATGLRFYDTDNVIMPRNPSTGASVNGTISLGEPLNRFKDLHLSGSIEIENGTGNVGVGKQALNSNTGSYNTALGYQAGYNNTSGSGSTFVGRLAGNYSNATGNVRNTFIGYLSGYTNTGTANTFIGAGPNGGSGESVTTGSKNTIIGGYNGNQGGLDIRTSNNNIVLSDGDGTPRIRVRSNGTTHFGPDFSDTNGSTGGAAFYAETGNRRTLYLATTSVGLPLAYFASSGGFVGSISVSSGATSYNTTSDYRLKENVVDLTGATERLKQIPVHQFNFISDPDTTVDGFIAHEVQDIVPEAVHGTKDAVDDDGNPVYQGIDQSKLVPLLVATIKELEARITALENA